MKLLMIIGIICISVQVNSFHIFTDKNIEDNANKIVENNLDDNNNNQIESHDKMIQKLRECGSLRSSLNKILINAVTNIDFFRDYDFRGGLSTISNVKNVEDLLDKCNQLYEIETFILKYVTERNKLDCRKIIQFDINTTDDESYLERNKLNWASNNNVDTIHNKNDDGTITPEPEETDEDYNGVSEDYDIAFISESEETTELIKSSESKSLSSDGTENPWTATEQSKVDKNTSVNSNENEEASFKETELMISEEENSSSTDGEISGVHSENSDNKDSSSGNGKLPGINSENNDDEDNFSGDGKNALVNSENSDDEDLFSGDGENVKVNSENSDDEDSSSGDGKNVQVNSENSDDEDSSSGDGENITVNSENSDDEDLFSTYGDSSSGDGENVRVNSERNADEVNFEIIMRKLFKVMYPVVNNVDINDEDLLIQSKDKQDSSVDDEEINDYDFEYPYY